MSYSCTAKEFDHDYMVRKLITYLKNNNYTGIEADIIGYHQPGLIYWKSNGKGHIPDVVAQKNGKIAVFEVETVTDLTSDHAKSQRKLFDANSMQQEKSFVLVVQKSAEADAKRQLELEGIQAEIWTIK